MPTSRPAVPFHSSSGDRSTSRNTDPATRLVTLTIAGIDVVRRELSPIVAEAVKEHSADVESVAREALRSRLSDRGCLDNAQLAEYRGIAERTAGLYRKQEAFGPFSVRFSRHYVRRLSVDAYLEAGVDTDTEMGEGTPGADE